MLRSKKTRTRSQIPRKMVPKTTLRTTPPGTAVTTEVSTLLSPLSIFSPPFTHALPFWLQSTPQISASTTANPNGILCPPVDRAISNPPAPPLPPHLARNPPSSSPTIQTKTFPQSPFDRSLRTSNGRRRLSGRGLAKLLLLLLRERGRGLRNLVPMGREEPRKQS